MVANLAPRKMKFGMSRRHGARRLGRRPGHLPARTRQRRRARHARQMTAVRSRRPPLARPASCSTVRFRSRSFGASSRGSRIGTLGLSAPRDLRFVSRVLFPAGVRGRRRARHRRIRRDRCSAGHRGAAARTAGPAVPRAPGSPCRAFFLLLLGAAGAAVSLFSAGYFRSSEGTPPGTRLLPVPRVPRRDGGSC